MDDKRTYDYDLTTRLNYIIDAIYNVVRYYIIYNRP